MNLFIPPLGTEIVLAEAWTFKLHSEYRNFDAFEYFNLLKKDQTVRWDLWRSSNDEHDVTIPAGTTLKVDRIYIRKGNRDFDSVTFFMKGVSKKRVRFWATLADVNKIIIKDLP